MPRMSRLFLAATLSTLAALLPVTAFAAGSHSLTVYVTGVQYAVGNPPWCLGTTSSFAGYARPNAVFNTTICHGSLSTKGVADIKDGSFQLVTSRRVLVGRYTGKSVGRGEPSPLYPGSTFLCKEVFPVTATFGPASPVPGATTILTGSTAMATLTHFGVFTLDGGCEAHAAAIAGWVTLVY